MPQRPIFRKDYVRKCTEKSYSIFEKIILYCQCDGGNDIFLVEL